MKIALIIHKLNIKGGVQRHVLAVGRELKRKGHGVKIYTFVFDKSAVFDADTEGAEIVSLQGYKPLRSSSEIMRENNGAKELAAMIDKDTEILNPHDQVCYKVAYYYKKHIKNIPAVWTMHDMPTKSWFFWRELQFRPDLKMSVLKKAAYLAIDTLNVKRFIKNMDGILVLDKRDKNWVKEFFGKDAEIIGNGLDILRFPFTGRALTAGRPINILMQGIFAVHRRFEDGIRALKILRDKGYDISLTIIGDVHSDKIYYNMILALIGEKELGKYVHLAGTVSEEDLLNAYKFHDIFLFPNHLQSWGLAVFEAMASGMPVMVSKTAGASEILKDGESAILINELQPQEIAQKIEILINDPVLYNNLSKNGRAFVENNISWSKLADKYENNFRKHI